MRRHPQKGFTLVELMVVVTISAILSAIAITRVFSFMRTSSTAEVAQDGSMIIGAISGYAQSQLQSASALQAQVDNTSARVNTQRSNGISTLIPQVQLPKDGHFNYKISAVVATDGPSLGDVVYCLTATGRSNAAVSGGKVLYSSVASTQAGWDGHVNRSAYLKGLTTLAGVHAGGYCLAGGAATATFSG